LAGNYNLATSFSSSFKETEYFAVFKYPNSSFT